MEPAPPKRPTPTTWVRLTIDAPDALELAAFYEALLGWPVTATDDGWCQLRDPEGGVGLNIQAEPAYVRPVWPEEVGRQQKMMHLEIQVDDLDAAVGTVEAAGGSQAAHQPPDRDQSRLRVMIDPAGHPFCLFLPGE